MKTLTNMRRRSEPGIDQSRSYQVSLFDSIDDVDPDAWRIAASSDELFFEPRFIRVVERTFAGEARFRHIMFRDKSGMPVACASLCIYHVDATTLAGTRLKRMITWTRRYFPRFGYLPVGMCGLPISLGEHSIGFKPGCDLDQIIQELDTVLMTFCSANRAPVVLLKEFDTPFTARLQKLLQLGYFLVESPHSHELDARFASLESYSHALRAHYRNDLRRSIRKFASAKLLSRRIRGADIAQHYVDSLHTMYLAVVAKAENKLEVLSAAFFRELAVEFGEQASLTLVEKEGRPVAFNYSLKHAHSYRFLFCGMDYQSISEGDVYFNLMYQDLDQGLREGVDVIRLGQASERFKARVGCRTVPLYFFVKGRHLWGPLLRQLSGVLFPVRPPPVEYNVFKE